MLHKIILQSGNHAVYDAQPQHVSNPQWIAMFGTQIAVRFGTEWRKNSGRDVVDSVTAQKLDALSITDGNES